MREIFVEQRKVLRLACYREQKFAVVPGDPLDVQLRKRASQACDFGFEEITPLCKNCVWFQILDVVVDGKPIVNDSKIDRSSVSQLAASFRASDSTDVRTIAGIAQEKAASLKVFQL